MPIKLEWSSLQQQWLFSADIWPPGWSKNDIPPLALAIGNFDGLHKGHQKIMAQLVAHAQKEGLTPAILSFDPHPRQFFAPHISHFTLTPLEIKETLLARYAVHHLLLLAFDDYVSHLSAQDFITEILLHKLNVKAIFVGDDFHFGKHRQGDIHLLRDFAQKYDFSLVSTSLLQHGDGEIITSTSIRNALEKGDITLANELLGRAWGFRATVLHGAKKGREIGYPTLNLRLSPDIKLPYGVYTIRVKIIEKNIEQENSIFYEGVASYGTRPVFDNGIALFEVHLFEFAQDIYDKEIEVDLIAYQREERNFSSIKALITQIEQDCLIAKQNLQPLRDE